MGVVDNSFVANAGEVGFVGLGWGGVDVLEVASSVTVGISGGVGFLRRTQNHDDSGR